MTGKTLKQVQLETPQGKRLDWQPARHRRFVAYTQRSMEVTVGERLQFTQGSRLLGYQNRELAEVKGIDTAKNELVLQGDRGKELRLSLAQSHTIDYGYATTTHGAQGATVDRVLVDLDTRTLATNAASYYVQVSRARHEAKIFTNDKAKLPEAVLRHEDKRAALELTQTRSKDAPRLQVPSIARGLPGLER